MEHLHTKVGNYKLIRFIGEGGMAGVYEGEHEILGTKVAVKILSNVLSANKQIRERFINEARLMASLDHPNITKVIEFDNQPNQLSIIMELLEGQDLSAYIRNKGKLNNEETVAVFSQVLDAFQYAHDKGIVHRDIKPSNIFIDNQKRIKILDFGIAKIFGTGNDFTQTGTQIGTPAYMSPEQVKGDKSVDYRSDIYSLGVTLLFMLSGKVPYDTASESNFDIFNKIVFEPLPELDAADGFKDIIAKACEKDREKRFQSCNAFKDALRHISAQQKTGEVSVAILPERTVVDKIAVGNKNESTIHEGAESFQKADQVKEKKVFNKNGFIIAGVLMLISVFLVFNLTKSDTSGYEITDPKVEFKSVKIGNQEWMAENLNVDKFRDGTPIPEAKTNEEWKKAGKEGSPAWCYYDNDPKNGVYYGILYNWYAVNDSRGLAPEGWHVPTGAEWNVLIANLDPSYNPTAQGTQSTTAGGKMKSTGTQYWLSPNQDATNSSGFSGLPGGFRDFDGTFNYVGNFGYWWSCTEINTSNAWGRGLDYSGGYVNRLNYYKVDGFSVRCLRD